MKLLNLKIRALHGVITPYSLIMDEGHKHKQKHLGGLVGVLPK